VGRFSAGLMARSRRPAAGSSFSPRRSEGSSSGGRGDRGGKSTPFQGGDNRGRSGGDRDRDRDRAREDRKRRQEVTAAAMREAQDAISKMQSEPGIDRLQLNPANSFLRRMQHQLISDHGFASESTGEADSRAVVILQAGAQKQPAEQAAD
jgi:R3H domain